MFTGQQQQTGDATLGLYDYKARFYSTTLGTFLSADSLTVQGTSSNRLNRYAYVDGNSLRFTDPSGHCVTIYGRTLPCSPQYALNILSCGYDVGACADAQWAMGMPLSFEEIARAHTFADWALHQGEFWNNFLLPSINPYWQDRQALRNHYVRPEGVGSLLQVGRQLYSPSAEQQHRNLVNGINDYCGSSGVNCDGIALNLGAIWFGMLDWNGLPQFARGLPGGSIYAAQVQESWDEYRRDPSDENFGIVWMQVFGGVSLPHISGHLDCWLRPTEKGVQDGH